MQCAQVVELLSSYIDGVLDEQTLERIESHLEACAECRRQLASLRALVVATSEIEPAEPPTRLRSEILAAVGAARQSVRQCAKVSDLLSAYIDGEVSGREQALVAEHLRVCEDCAAEHAALVELTSIALASETLTPPRDLRERIAAAVAAEPTPSASLLTRVRDLVGSWREWKPATAHWAGGAVAAGALAVAVVVTTGPPPAPAPEPAASARQAERLNPPTTPRAPKVAAVAVRPESVANAARPSRSAGPRFRVARVPHSDTPVADVIEPKRPPVPAAKPAATHLPVVAEQPEPEATVAATISDETPSVETASVAAPVVETPPQPKAGETPEPVRMAVAAFSEDAKAWASEIKEKAAMQRGQGRGAAFPIITTRF